MATKTDIIEDPCGMGYIIQTNIGKVDLRFTRNPEAFLEEVHFQTAKLLAEQIISEIIPDIKESLRKRYSDNLE